METINIYLTPNANNKVNPTFSAYSEKLSEIQVLAEGDTIEEIKEKVLLQLKEARKLFRESKMKIPQKLNSIYRLQLHLKNYMVGGVNERIITEKKEIDEAKKERRAKDRPSKKS